MQKHLNESLKRGICLLAVLGLSACGGGDEPPVAAPVVLGGQVTASGAAVANAHVIAMNRLTNQEFSAYTDTDGHYRMALPRGDYDLGSEDGAMHHAAIVGPVSLDDTATTRDIALPAADPGLFFGTLLRPDGQPAAGYALQVSSNTGDLYHVEETITAEDGSFSMPLGGQRAFDLDVFDPTGALVEFIDLHKLDGSLKVTLQLASDEARRNVFRHDQTANMVAASVQTAAADEPNSPFRQAILSGDYNFMFWGGRLVPKAVNMPWGYKLDVNRDARQNWFLFNDAEGSLPDDYFISIDLEDPELTPEEVWAQVTRRVALQDRGQPHLGVFVGDNGLWWYDYAVNVNVTEKSWSNLGLKGWDWHFKDESDDEPYVLTIRWNGWHQVSYNSKTPAIIKAARSRPGVLVPLPSP